MVDCIYGHLLSFDCSLRTSALLLFFTQLVSAELYLFSLLCPCSLQLVGICDVLMLRWVHGSLINCLESCLYITEHTSYCKQRAGPRKGYIACSNQDASDHFSFSFSLFFIFLHNSISPCLCALFFFTCLLIVFLLVACLFQSFSLFSLPSRHAEASKLIGNYRTPLLLAHSHP